MVALLLAAIAAPTAWWVDGTFEDPAVMQIDRRHDPAFAPSGALSGGRGPEVGDTVLFWAQDYTSDPFFTFYLTPATCRFAGEESYIFVEDAVWGVHYDEGDVAVFAAALEDSTPSGPAGIVERDTGVFGPVPDELDGDPRVYFLVLDIRDGFDPLQGGAYIAGFFSPYNQFTEEEAFLYYGGHSNEVEMLYIDCFPGNSDDASYTASHELVHLIQWGVRPFSGEELWVIENQAQSGTFVCGYPASQVETFLEVGGVSPVGWTEFEDIVEYVAGYGSGFLFFSYLCENYGGDDFLYNSLRVQTRGLPGVEEAVEQATGSSVDMQAVLEDWMLACWIDDKSVGDGRWGWEAFRISDYDTISPGSRPGLDWQGVVSSSPWEDPAHPLPAFTIDGYDLQGAAMEGSFRASASGLGRLSAWFRPSPSGPPVRLPSGEGRDVALPLPADGEVLLACFSFFGLDLSASAGDLQLSGADLAVFPQPCLGTLYFGFLSDGGEVELHVFEETGRLVDSVEFGPVAPGETVAAYPGAAGLASGVYLYRFVQGGAVRTGRFAVVR